MHRPTAALIRSIFVIPSRSFSRLSSRYGEAGRTRRAEIAPRAEVASPDYPDVSTDTQPGIVNEVERVDSRGLGKADRKGTEGGFSPRGFVTRHGLILRFRRSAANFTTPFITSFSASSFSLFLHGLVIPRTPWERKPTGREHAALMSAQTRSNEGMFERRDCCWLDEITDFARGSRVFLEMRNAEIQSARTEELYDVGCFFVLRPLRLTV